MDGDVNRLRHVPLESVPRDEVTGNGIHFTGHAELIRARRLGRGTRQSGRHMLLRTRPKSM